MLKKRSHWESLLELNSILGKEIWNKVSILNNITFNWDNLSEKNKKIIENKMGELRDKLHIIVTEKSKKK